MTKPTRKLVCHLGKFGKGHMTGLQIHHQREKESRTNPTIDSSRSHLNYDLHNREPIKFLQAAKTKIDEQAPKARLRKDSIYCIEAELSAGKKFWETASPQEQKRFFEEAYKFMCDRHGKENALYSVVHMDESTPHMHFGYVPITPDGRLNAKDSGMNQKDMGKIHVDFYKYMQRRGFNIEKGEPAKEKHLEPQQWKVQELEKQEKVIRQRATKLKNTLDKGISFVQDLRAEKQRLEQAIKPLQEIKKTSDEIQKMEAGGVLFDKERVKVKKDDWKTLQYQAAQVELLTQDNQRLDQENRLLHEQVQQFNGQIDGMRQKVEMLKDLAENHRNLKEYVKGLELKLDLIEEELGIEFDLDFEDLGDQEMSPKRKKRRGSARLQSRKRPNDRPPGRHQRQRSQPQPKQQRTHGKIVDRGRF